MKSLTLLIKPASSNCNLRCSYCFYNDVSEHREQKSYEMMSKETTTSLIQKAFDCVEEDGVISFCFQGGEPIMAGLAYFEFFVDTVNTYKKNQTVHYALQTNGTMINEQWASFFYKNHFLVGVSLDGFEKNMDMFRYDIKKRGVFQKVLRCAKILDKYRVEYNILTVVSKQLAMYPEKLYEFYQKHHFHYVQLIPCLPSLEKNSLIDSNTSLTPKDYTYFFTRFFDCWKKDLHTNRYIDVNIFTNIIALLQGKAPYQCGMLGRCSIQFVVEGDGSVFPCDFYVLDELKMGNLTTNNFNQLIQSNSAKQFLDNQEAKNDYCNQCRFIKLCNGGCKRQNTCYLDNSYCGYQQLLEHVIRELS